MTNIDAVVELNNGIKMPLFGLGVFRAREGGEVESAVAIAIENGYRIIDTAQDYHNEEGVGNAIKSSGIPREELFITSKISNKKQGYHSTKKAFHETLEKLQTDYLDLFLIHWPIGKKMLDTWRAMEELYEEGYIRAIGVSNFKIHHLVHLLDNCRIKPAVNQVEFHPEHTQSGLHNFCKSNNIQLQGWGPLNEGRVNTIPEIKSIAAKYNKTPAQIALRWNLQKQVIAIPKSVATERIISNSEIFDFHLAEHDVKKIDSLNKDNPRLIVYDEFMFLLEILFKQRNKSVFMLFMEASVYKIKKRINLISLFYLFMHLQPETVAVL